MSSTACSDETQKFHDELRWCISQLELGLQRQDPDSRQAMETIKILKILRSPKAPLVKKRQAMRSALGDYRKKMKESEKKFLSCLRNSRFQRAGNTKAQSKSKFLRQSYSRTADRDELGSHLSNLHLQQSSAQDSPNQPSSSDPCGPSESSSLPVDSSAVASGSTTEVNGLSCSDSRGLSLTVSRSEAGLRPVNDCSDGNADPSIASASSALQTNSSAASTFHFVPSDNSFSFGFSDESASKTDDMALEESGDCPKSEPGNKIHMAGDVGVKPNVFKYERTDNNFAFNFG